MLAAKTSRLSLALLVLFVLSGFAGLIYQSVWSNYLGLTLGHAAYAQTLVLSIFMGGMALGAWLASHYGVRWRQLILGYAVIEGVIGLMGLLFHPLFVAYTGFSQDTVLPALGSISLAHAYQWLSAALMITPQSILLGATFPLMSAGLIRAMPSQHGEVLGGLYFSNSLGAALGALVATFVLLPAVGLPGSVLTAGLLNLVVAAGAWLVSQQLVETDLPVVHEAPVSRLDTRDGGKTSSSELKSLARTLLWATAISGAASFVYEVGWVRLLNQAFGATIHSFELMLAAFILGLAFGGLWIRRRAASLAEPVRYVGYVQVWMAVAALVSIPMFTQSFTWVGWLMSALSRTSNGYALYELGTALISLMVMFPAAFLAGMTLPLFTLALLRQGAGERAIGRIYAANTLGAIVGVALAMHVLIPLIGVRLAVTLAALVDGLVGLYLLRVLNPGRMSRPVGGVALAMMAAVAFSLAFGIPDPKAQVASVFRTGVVQIEEARVEFLRDGKTATVAVFDTGNFKTISTNNKPDASLTSFEQAPTNDEVTMVMLGTLPLVLHPRPEEIAVIGWGSALSTHTLLGSDRPRTVDTVEIEPAIVEGARLFGGRVSRAYDDPRSRLHIDDARTFFSTGNRKFDVIVSEPSNPWVSGVASLFTQEFYGFLRNHLKPGGMVVQWLHTYEIDDVLFATMISALLTEFPDSDLYVTNTSDVVIVARTAPAATTPMSLPSGVDGALRAELQRVGLSSTADLALRRIGGGRVLRAYVDSVGATPHSDYFPTVSLQAPRTRFMGQSANVLESTITSGLPALDVLDCRLPIGRAQGLALVEASTPSLLQHRALARIDALAGAVDTRYASVGDDTAALLATTRALPGTPALLPAWTRQVAQLASQTIGFLPASDLKDTFLAATWVPADVAVLPDVALILSAYSASARRDVRSMYDSAVAVLALSPSRQSPDLREQMVSIAMLGALGLGEHRVALELEARYGADLSMTPARRFIGAWARSGQPACVARRAKS